MVVLRGCLSWMWLYVLWDWGVDWFWCVYLWGIFDCCLWDDVFFGVVFCVKGVLNLFCGMWLFFRV